MSEYKPTGLSVAQMNIADNIRNIDQFKVFEKMFAYGEYLLEFNFQSCPKGWIKRKDMALTPDQVRAFIWIYNMVLFCKTREDSARVQKWIEISTTDKVKNQSSWRYCDVPYEVFYPHGVYQALFMYFMWTIIFPEQTSNLAKIDDIINRLETLNYDYDLVLEDSSKNYGWLYARMFDLQAVNVIRYIFKRR